MRIKSIREIEPEPSRCIQVDSTNRLFAVGGDDGKSVITHNSVVQRNIILGCILRPDNWYFLGIDLKKVELYAFRAYSNVVLGIATTVEDALSVLRFAQQTMMKRYASMEELGVNNFLDLPEKGKALMVMVDEAGELLSPSGVKALSEFTKIPVPAGQALLKDLEIGDTVYDNYGRVTQITNKYEPEKQLRFDMKITSDKTNASENFVAGAEHNWVAYFTYPNGDIEGPEIVTTEYLYEFKNHMNTLPENQRTLVKFKRG